MPFFNNETGAMDSDSPDLVTGATERPAELDRQQQEDRARREAIGTGKKPGEPEPAEQRERPEGYRDTAQFGREEYERLRADALGDPQHPLNDARHPNHEVTVEKYLRLGMMADGKDADDPEQNPPIGELFDGKILRPEDNPPVRIPTLSEDARAAFGLDPAEAAAVVEHQEALVDLSDQSGMPRYHIEGLIEDVGGAMEDLARDDDTDTPEAGLAALVRLEGGRARSIITDAQQLVQLLHDSGQPNLVAAAEDLIATSNSPRVLIGAARLYQELKNLPPQGPWEQILLGRGTKWAQQQAAAKARAEQTATADQTPGDHVVVQHGRL
jgi:hypothetical protein